jgi:uncharacterized protein YcbX
MPDLVVRSAGLSPVKGTRHLPLQRLEIDEQGPVGDRSWCFVDVAARRVLRTVQHPALIAVVAVATGDGLGLTLPNGERADGVPEPTGETLTCDYWGRPVGLALTDGPHAELVSRHLGSDVRLAAAPRGGVVFAAPVTLVGTATLRDLAEAVGRPVEAARFRATLVVETDEPYVEDTWLGAEVGVGGATLQIGGTVPRCAVVDHHPDTGVRDLRLLGAMARSRPTNAAGEPVLGVYAEVVRPGTVFAAMPPNHL